MKNSFFYIKPSANSRLVGVKQREVKKKRAKFLIGYESESEINGNWMEINFKIYQKSFKLKIISTSAQ